MSDEGEKTCPLCAEEMDLTDQQLRPCKCGYEVCSIFFWFLLAVRQVTFLCLNSFSVILIVITGIVLRIGS